MLGLRFLVPYVLPFLLSFCLVYACRPLLGRVQRRLHLHRSVTMGLLLLAAVLLAAGVLALLCVWGSSCAGAFVENLDEIEKQCRFFLHGCCQFAENRWHMDAADTEQLILNRVQVFAQNIQVNLMPRLVKGSYGYVKGAASFLALLGITGIASLLFAKDMEKILERLENCAATREAAGVTGRILHTLGAYAKAQGKILAVITGLCLAGLWLVGVKGFYVLAVLAGLLDVLPFIGTGIVLLPTAAWQLIAGNSWGALGVVILYGCCVAARELLEPKLIGDGLGIYPVVMLFSIYAGVKFFGISGILKGPIAAVLIKEVVDKYGKSS